MADNITPALERYNTVSRELSSAYHERAKLQSAILMDYDDAYQNAILAMAYNPAQAVAKSATRRWQTELNKLQGEIDAYLCELRYLDIYLKVAHHGSPS